VHYIPKENTGLRLDRVSNLREQPTNALIQYGGGGAEGGGGLKITVSGVYHIVENKEKAVIKQKV